MKTSTHSALFRVSQIIITAVIALMVCMPMQLDAKKKKKKKKVDNEITAIDKKGYSFQVNNKIYIVSDRAVISLDGKKTTFKKLDNGMSALVTSRLLNAGTNGEKNTYEATRISAQSNKKRK